MTGLPGRRGRTWLNSLAEDAAADLDEWDIQSWAGHPDPADGGMLPERSARAFADWLWDNWTEFYAEGEGKTVEDVLKGAVQDWCGGRTFH